MDSRNKMAPFLFNRDAHYQAGRFRPAEGAIAATADHRIKTKLLVGKRQANLPKVLNYGSRTACGWIAVLRRYPADGEVAPNCRSSHTRFRTGRFDPKRLFIVIPRYERPLSCDKVAGRRSCVLGKPSN